MYELEKYLMDLRGFLLIKEALEKEKLPLLLSLTKSIHEFMQRNIDLGPFFDGHYGIRYTYSEENGIFYYRQNSDGIQYICDDFLNWSEAFNFLIDNDKLIPLISTMSLAPFHISSSEIRIREHGNYTPTHMGGPMDDRNGYQFKGKRITDTTAGRQISVDINLPVIRVLYALEDIGLDNGPFCCIPGSHKSNFQPPFSDGGNPRNDPLMQQIPMKAGDALIFSENLRHGGMPVTSMSPRMTLHMQYTPQWMASQSPAHWGLWTYSKPTIYKTYSELQKQYFHKFATSQINNLYHST